MKFLVTLALLFFISLAAEAQSKRSKFLNFEDEMVEGINRKPLDSVSQLSDKNKNPKNHLYRKRAGFADRDQVLLHELRLQP